MPSEKEKLTESTDETFIDQSLGLVLRRDPFGGEHHDIVDIFDPSQWDVLEEDFGPVIDWATSPIVAGKLINQKIVMIDHDDTRGTIPTNIYCIVDALSKERRAFYGNFQLDQAMGCQNPDPEDPQKSPYIGRDMLVKWEGKREQNKGGRTLNVYTVAVKKTPIEEGTEAAQEDPF